ncbi:hypothetical protein [Caballeronia arationis]|uniref:hypothetical protein n=1 Tax=Caballeronia arationis TaxID=1777142 RepID=UPI00135BCE88|nr:hypothetical protein [Caballeronia arationis]
MTKIRVESRPFVRASAVLTLRVSFRFAARVAAVDDASCAAAAVSAALLTGVSAVCETAFSANDAQVAAKRDFKSFGLVMWFLVIK